VAEVALGPAGHASAFQTDRLAMPMAPQRQPLAPRQRKLVLWACVIGAVAVALLGVLLPETSDLSLLLFGAAAALVLVGLFQWSKVESA